MFGGEEKCTEGLVDKPEGNRPLARPRPRCEDNIKVDFRETGWECMDWVDLAQNVTSNGLL
jgi:hypothetical protein